MPLTYNGKPTKKVKIDGLKSIYHAMSGAEMKSPQRTVFTDKSTCDINRKADVIDIKCKRSLGRKYNKTLNDVKGVNIDGHIEYGKMFGMDDISYYSKDFDKISRYDFKYLTNVEKYQNRLRELEG